jgi:ornithine carbamoyltransferase
MKHFLALEDFSAAELRSLLDLAKRFKRDQKNGEAHTYLSGKILAMIFQKPSQRTRVSFEVAMRQLGGEVVTLQEYEVGLGKREPVRDVAGVLSRYVHGVMMRVNSHSDLEAFAKFSDVPIINGLSDIGHPCQALADFLTIEEKKGDLKNVTLCYIGDGNNVCRSLIEGGSILGAKVVVSCPEKYLPSVDKKHKFEVISDPAKAAKDADVIYTDTWTSMGQEAEASIRRRDFKNYRVTLELMKKARRGAIFMHCMPIHHGEEAAHDVPYSPCSVIFDQAENRVHAQKAILVELLAKWHKIQGEKNG